MAHRILLVRLALAGVLAVLAACTTGPSLPDDEGPVIAAGNFAGALVSEDYDEAFSYLTPETQAAIRDPAVLEGRFGGVCETGLTRYTVQMQPTEGDGFIVNTGTLTCADGAEVAVVIVTENTGPGLWLVRDFQVSETGFGG